VLLGDLDVEQATALMILEGRVVQVDNRVLAAVEFSSREDRRSAHGASPASSGFTTCTSGRSRPVSRRYWRTSSSAVRTTVTPRAVSLERMLLDELYRGTAEACAITVKDALG
jgi:hypothetical protein